MVQIHTSSCHHVRNENWEMVPCNQVPSDEEQEMEVPFSEKRCNIINELLATEKDFLECLEIVRDLFIGPLKTNNALAEDEMEIIFINWNDILLCSTRLYKSLKIRRKMTGANRDMNIGDILCENVIFFRNFVSYRITQPPLLSSASAVCK